MKKNKKVWGIFAIAILAIGYLAYANFLKPEAQAVAVTNTTTEKTEFNTIENIIETTDHNDYSIQSEYPHFTDESINAIIIDFIGQQHEDFLSKLQDKTFDSKATLTITNEIIQGLSSEKNIIFTITSLINNKTESSIETLIISEDLKQLITIEEIINEDMMSDTVFTKLITDHLESKKLPMDKIHEIIADRSIFTNAFISEENFYFYYTYKNTYIRSALPLTSLVFALQEPYRSIIKDQMIVNEPVDMEPKKQVALTFDDGPHPKFTPKILNSLEKYHAKATFFMLGREVENNPTIAQEVANAGHQIGNHSWFHENLSKLSTTAALENINRTNEKIFEITGQYPTAFRPPYGATNQALNTSLPMDLVMWTIDPKDWKYRNTNLIMDVIKTHLKDGSIILLHDVHGETADSLETILNYIDNKGYEFVTVDTLLKRQLNEK